MKLLRHPMLAALLLLASPALGGQVLPLLHSCEAAAGGHAHGSEPGQQGGHTGHAESAVPDAGAEAPASCTCIGSCTTAASLEAPLPRVAATATARFPARMAPVSPETAAPRTTPHLALLPPTTAPPRA